MKAWRHNTTLQLYDIQTIPGPLPSEYDPLEWELVDVSDADIQAFYYNFESDKTDRLLLLNREVNQFIYARYDAGTQSSFLAIYQKTTVQAVKDALDLVWTWSGAVMQYYYSIKTQMQATTGKAALDAISWNFEVNFGDTGVILPDPQIKLSTFYGF